MGIFTSTEGTAILVVQDGTISTEIFTDVTTENPLNRSLVNNIGTDTSENANDGNSVASGTLTRAYGQGTDDLVSTLFDGKAEFDLIIDPNNIRNAETPIVNEDLTQVTSIAGTMSATAGSAPVTVTGVGTNFLSILEVGDEVLLDAGGTPETVIVGSITNDLEFITSDDVANTHAAVSATMSIYPANGTNKVFYSKYHAVRSTVISTSVEVAGASQTEGTDYTIEYDNTDDNEKGMVVKFVVPPQQGDTVTMDYTPETGGIMLHVGCRFTNVQVNPDGSSDDQVSGTFPYTAEDWILTIGPDNPNPLP